MEQSTAYKGAIPTITSSRQYLDPDLNASSPGKGKKMGLTEQKGVTRTTEDFGDYFVHVGTIIHDRALLSLNIPG